MKKAIILTLLAVLFIGMGDVLAQCPMCRSAVESGLMEEGNKIGIGLNDGIIYLLATPYLIVLVIGGLWYRRYRRSH